MTMIMMMMNPIIMHVIHHCSVIRFGSLGDMLNALFDGFMVKFEKIHSRCTSPRRNNLEIVRVRLSQTYKTRRRQRRCRMSSAIVVDITGVDSVEHSRVDRPGDGSGFETGGVQSSSRVSRPVYDETN